MEIGRLGPSTCVCPQPHFTNGEGETVQPSMTGRGNVRVEILKMKKCLILDKCELETNDMEIQAVGWREEVN